MLRVAVHLEDASATHADPQTTANPAVRTPRLLPLLDPLPYGSRHNSAHKSKEIRRDNDAKRKIAGHSKRVRSARLMNELNRNGKEKYVKIRKSSASDWPIWSAAAK